MPGATRQPRRSPQWGARPGLALLWHVKGIPGIPDGVRACSAITRSPRFDHILEESLPGLEGLCAHGASPDAGARPVATIPSVVPDGACKNANNRTVSTK